MKYGTKTNDERLFEALAGYCHKALYLREEDAQDLIGRDVEVNVRYREQEHRGEWSRTQGVITREHVAEAERWAAAGQDVVR